MKFLGSPYGTSGNSGSDAGTLRLGGDGGDEAEGQSEDGELHDCELFASDDLVGRRESNNGNR